MSTLTPIAHRFVSGDLPTQIILLGNPFDGIISNEQLLDILEAAANPVATNILELHNDGTYKRDSMGFAIGDPTAPGWKPSFESILALVAIGLEGVGFLPNGIDKFVNRRDRGRDTADIIENAPFLLPAGAFRHSGTGLVKGVLSGGSGQSVKQDAEESTDLSGYVAEGLGAAYAAWIEENPEGRWFNDQDQPGPEVQALIDAIQPALDELEEAAQPVDPIEAYGPDASSRSTVYQAD